MNTKILLAAAAAAAALWFLSRRSQAAPGGAPADVQSTTVYGGTPSGTVAAIDVQAKAKSSGLLSTVSSFKSALTGKAVTAYCTSQTGQRQLCGVAGSVASGASKVADKVIVSSGKAVVSGAKSAAKKLKFW